MKRPIHLLLVLILLGQAACSVQGNEPAPPEEAQQAQDIQLVTMVDTQADEPLAKVPMVASSQPRLPDTPQGYRAQAMLEALRAADTELLVPFLQEHYDPDFLVQVPQNDHTALLRQLQEKIKQTEISAISSQEQEYRIELLQPHTQQKWVLDIYFQPTAPYKIAGVRLL